MLFCVKFSAINVCSIALESPNGACVVYIREKHVRIHGVVDSRSLQIASPISAVGYLAVLLCGKDNVRYLHTNDRTVLFLNRSGFSPFVPASYNVPVFFCSTHLYRIEFEFSCHRQAVRNETRV